MAEVVDAIVAELIARDNGYTATYDRAIAKHREFTASVPKIDGIEVLSKGAKRYADQHAQSLGKVVKDEQQANDQISASRKRRATAAKAADEAEVASAKAAAKAKADAARAEQVAIARVREAEIKAFRQQRQEMMALRATEREINNQAKASAFLTGYRPANGQRGEGGPSGRSARSSAAVFRESFKAEELAARDAAKQESILAVERDKAAAAAAREAEQTSRLSAVAERAAARRAAGLPRGSGRMNTSGAVVQPGDAVKPSAIPLAALNGEAAAEVVAESEINHLLVDQASLQGALTFARGRDRDIIRDQLAEMRLIKQLQAAGLDDAAIAVKLDERALAIEAERAAVAKKQAGANLARFAEGAGVGRTGGSAFAVGGLVTAGIAAGTAAAVKVALDYADAIKAQAEALGITTKEFQVYTHAASQANVTQEQLSSGLGQFSANLGKAQDGAQQQSKIFKALDVDIGNATTGFKSAGDVLPDLIARLSSIPEAAQRAAVETALFGEEGRRLDPLLSGGTGAINNLADAMERAGSVVTNDDIDTLHRASQALSDVKQAIEADIAHSVANDIRAIESLTAAFDGLSDKIGGAIQRLIQFAETSPSGLLSAAGYALETGVRLGSRGAADNGKDPASTLRGTTAPGLLDRALHPGQVDRSALAKLFAPKPPKGRKGPKGPTEEQKAADLEAREASLNEQRLSAIADLTQSAEDRAAAANAQLDAERASFARSLADDKKLTAAQRAKLLAEEDLVIAKRRAKVSQDALNQVAEDELRLRQADRTAYLDELRSEEALATTAAERRRLELAALRTQQAAETDAAQTALKTNPQGSAAYLQAQADLDPSNPNGIASRYGYANKAVRANTRGPLGDYLASLPRTADQVDEALQQAAVGGLQSLNDGLSTAVDKFLHLHGIAGQFLSDLIKIGIERELLIPLADSLFPGKSSGGSSGGGGLFGSIIAAIGSAFGAGSGLSSASTGGFNVGSIGGDVPFAFAGGGAGVIGGNPGIDRNILSINNRPVARVGAGELLSVQPNIAPSSARILPAQPAGVQLHQTVNIDASGVNPEGYTKGILGIVRTETAKAIQQSAAATLNAAPARVQRVQTLGS